MSDATNEPLKSVGVEWIVIFADRPPGNRRWWHWFTCKGFAHVCATTYDPLHGLWLFVDWNMYNLEPKVLGEAEADILFSLMYEGATFLRYTSHRPKRATTRSVCLYCVSMIKHLLGVKSFAVTPYQLFCALKKNGGEVIVPQAPQED